MVRCLAISYVQHVFCHAQGNLEKQEAAQRRSLQKRRAIWVRDQRQLALSGSSWWLELLIYEAWPLLSSSAPVPKVRSSFLIFSRSHELHRSISPFRLLTLLDKLRNFVFFATWETDRHERLLDPFRHWGYRSITRTCDLMIVPYIMIIPTAALPTIYIYIYIAIYIYIYKYITYI